MDNKNEKGIEPCATSSENYWKQRCEAAENMVEAYQIWYSPDEKNSQENNEAYNNFHQSVKIWNQLKSQTPSPTGDRDCEELKEKLVMSELDFKCADLLNKGYEKRINELEDENRRLQFMIDNKLGDSDMINDNQPNNF